MAYDDHTPSGAAPARARSKEPADSAPDEVSPPNMGFPEQTPPQDLQDQQDFSLPPPHAPQSGPGLSGDLRVPWGWLDVMLFVVLGIVSGVVITWGLAEVSVRLFGLNPTEVFGTTMSTAKSIIVLSSQALLDLGAILFLYLLLMTRTSAPFWPSIGWREMKPGSRKIRDLALQFLAGGAVLAIVVSFVGAFFNSKATLPIEQLLQARVSILLFGILGVLVAPLVEETIFRGFLYPVIARWLGVVAGVLITGTLFGLMHAAQLWGGWGQIALLILVGIVLTWVRARTGTVAASYFVHLGYNGLQLVGYLIYVIGHK